MQRVTPSIGKAFGYLEASIKTKFMAEIFEEKNPLHLPSLSGFPVKNGGMAIPDLSATVESNYLAFTCEYSHLISELKGTVTLDYGTHKTTMKEVRIEVKKIRIDKAEEWIQTYKSRCKDGVEKGRIYYLQENGVDTWLAAIPSFIYGTTLSSTEFQDELRLRYGLKLKQTTNKCDRCDEKCSVPYALACKFGDLTHSCHDECRDIISILACTGCLPSSVRDEPVINIVRVKEEETKTGKKAKLIEECSEIKIEKLTMEIGATYWCVSSMRRVHT